MSTPGWTVSPDTEAPARKTGLGWWARRMLTLVDTGVGTDLARTVIAGGLSDTGVGIDVVALKFATAVADVGLGFDYTLAAAVADAFDAGVGFDVSTALGRTFAVDAALGADHAVRRAAVRATDVALGVDSAAMRLLTALEGVDAAVGHDFAAPTPFVAVTDSGVGVDSSRIGFKPPRDTGVGTDVTQARRVRVAAPHTAIGADTTVLRTRVSGMVSATDGVATFEADDAPTRAWLHGFSGLENFSREGNADWAYAGRGALVCGWAQPGTFPGVVTPRYPAGAGQAVSLSAQITAGPANVNKHVSGLIRFFDAAGNWLTQAQHTEDNDSSWRLLYMRSTCPAGTASVDYALIMGLAGEYGASDYFAADNIAANIAANPLTGVGVDSATAGFKQFAAVTTTFAGSGQAGTTFGYDIPWWANIVDLIAVGAGGGGQGGALLSVGTGATAGSFASRRLVRGTDIPWTTTRLTGTIGRGGNGSGYNVFGSPKGDDGAATTWDGFFSAAGGVGRTSPSSQSAGLSPGSHTFQGVTVNGGGQVGTGATGSAPGGGGGGGNNAASGGPGASGGAWATARQ